MTTSEKLRRIMALLTEQMVKDHEDNLRLRRDRRALLRAHELLRAHALTRNPSLADDIDFILEIGEWA